MSGIVYNGWSCYVLNMSKYGLVESIRKIEKFERLLFGPKSVSSTSIDKIDFECDSYVGNKEIVRLAIQLKKDNYLKFAFNSLYYYLSKKRLTQDQLILGDAHYPHYVSIFNLSNSMDDNPFKRVNELLKSVIDICMSESIYFVCLLHNIEFRRLDDTLKQQLKEKAFNIYCFPRRKDIAESIANLEELNKRLNSIILGFLIKYFKNKIKLIKDPNLEAASASSSASTPQSTDQSKVYISSLSSASPLPAAKSSLAAFTVTDKKQLSSASEPPPPLASSSPVFPDYFLPRASPSVLSSASAHSDQKHEEHEEHKEHEEEPKEYKKLDQDEEPYQDKDPPDTEIIDYMNKFYENFLDYFKNCKKDSFNFFSSSDIGFLLSDFGSLNLENYKANEKLNFNTFGCFYRTIMCDKKYSNIYTLLKQIYPKFLYLSDFDIYSINTIMREILQDRDNGYRVELDDHTGKLTKISKKGQDYYPDTASLKPTFFTLGGHHERKDSDLEKLDPPPDRPVLGHSYSAAPSLSLPAPANAASAASSSGSTDNFDFGIQDLKAYVISDKSIVLPSNIERNITKDSKYNGVKVFTVNLKDNSDANMNEIIKHINNYIYEKLEFYEVAFIIIFKDSKNAIQNALFFTNAFSWLISGSSLQYFEGFKEIKKLLTCLSPGNSCTSTEVAINYILTNFKYIQPRSKFIYQKKIKKSKSIQKKIKKSKSIQKKFKKSKSIQKKIKKSKSIQKKIKKSKSIQKKIKKSKSIQKKIKK